MMHCRAGWPGWLVLALWLATVSCGSDPIGPQPPISGDAVAYTYVNFAELNRYLGDMRDAFVSVEVMRDEFTVVSQDWLTGRIDRYWSVEFTRNMVKRQQILMAEAHVLAPSDPELAEAHLIYEDALRRFGTAYSVFFSQVEIPDPSTWDGVNSEIVEASLQLLRWQEAMTRLSGRLVRFVVV